MATLQDALAYVNTRSWAVFPVHTVVDGKCTCNGASNCSPGKHPRTPNGFQDATTDPGIISMWWEEWVDEYGITHPPMYPDSNIGVATGSTSGILVVDVDIKHDGLQTWTELQDMNGMVNTMTSITGSGGNHYFFRLPEGYHDNGLLKNTTGTIGPGVDTRGDGGYIILPPSTHVSGDAYEWVRPLTVEVEPPEWLISLWKKPNSDVLHGTEQPEAPPIGDAPRWVSQLLDAGAPEGKRNSEAHRLASYFRSKLLPRDVIAQVMTPFADRCNPPFEIKELYATIDSAQRYAIIVQAAGVNDPPEFTEHGGILEYVWSKANLRIQVEELWRNHQGLHSEVTVDLLGDEPRQIIGPVSYNMTSVSGRDNMVKSLKNRMEADWYEVLQTLARLCNEHIRAGQDVVDLRDYTDRPWSQWALEPFILDDMPSIIFGDGGLGKSLIALAAMCSLNTGRVILPGLDPEASHKGLYLDWESTSYEHGSRFKQLMRGIGESPKDHPILHMQVSQSIGLMVPVIRRHIESEGVTFLIIDSAGLACGGDPASVDSALKFFEALRTLKVPSLIITHQSKGDTSQKPFGSVYWHNMARNTWEIKKHQVPGETVLHVGLFNRKVNGASPHPPVGFKIEFDSISDSITITPADIKDTPELAGDVDAIEFIRRELMDSEPRTTRDIADALEMKWDTVNQTLNRWLDRPNGVIKVGTIKPVKWTLIDTP